MSWNEPGNGGRDPWSRDHRPSGGGKGPQWDDLFNKLRQHMGRFGKGGGGIVTIIVAIILAWLILSSYTVIGARETGVVLRLGAYSRALPPGFHLKLPSPFEHVYKVKTTQVRSVSDSVQMLTNDENIVHVDFNVQWQVSDARKFLFSMRDPEQTIREAAEAAVRAVVGANTMDTILSGQGAELVAKTRQRLQQVLDEYNAGLRVTEISFQNVAPPDQVKAAFDDVNKAREDKQRIENEAQAYASQVIPVARGNAARIAAEAAGYKAARIARAEGDVQRFSLMLAQYKMAPQVTRMRLWLETMEDILAAHPKVVDGSNGRNVFYLKLGAGQATTSSEGTTTMPGVGQAIGPDTSTSGNSSASDKGDGQ
ncbi:MAG TPA: FtsH protease activity modulator HflK [Rhodanobacteraceae bacterium]|nr:FtsH protease activity modulator HflK [Rhodanobacteraceae bacterium]